MLTECVAAMALVSKIGAALIDLDEVSWVTKGAKSIS